MSRENVAARRPLVASGVIGFSVFIGLAISGFGVSGVVTAIDRFGLGMAAAIVAIGVAATGLCALVAIRGPRGWSAAVLCGVTSLVALVTTLAVMLVTVGLALQGSLP